MAAGGSGKCLTMHVRFTVEPVSMYRSGPPWIVVIGSKKKIGLIKNYGVESKAEYLVGPKRKKLVRRSFSCLWFY